MIDLIKLDDGCIEIVLHPEAAQDLQDDFDTNGPESAMNTLFSYMQDNGFDLLDSEDDDEDEKGENDDSNQDSIYGPPIIGEDLTLDPDGYVQLTPSTRAWFFSAENPEKNFVEELLEHGYITFLPLNFEEFDQDDDQGEDNMNDNGEEDNSIDGEEEHHTKIIGEQTNFHHISMKPKDKNRV